MADRGERPDYEFVDMNTRGEGAVATAFANQVAYCENAGAPITARVVGAIADVLASDASNALIERIRTWHGAPLADALPLRIAGGIHALHLSGDAKELAPIYRGISADDAALVRDAMLAFEAPLMPWLDGPPQTNEAGRSSNFSAAMLWLADKGLTARFALLEIGSSAGINLMMDRYRYDLGGIVVGPEQPAMHFAPEWNGSPPPAADIAIVSAKGCDVAPVDLTDPAQALRLKAYIWPEHTVRFDRMEAAIRAATERKPDLVRMNAAEFVEDALAKPQVPGTTRVLMHSIVWQYVPQDQQQRVTAAMESAGAAATADRPLAWVSVEADRTVHRHMLKVRYWPGGEEAVQLAWSHPHGADMEWLG
ncbi:DUF2332 domain-containing protein [Parerythrobacter lacustris]|uniref:DUF2332 domain-containing protein n=1 Tax=Parerythrobacter lacustris TaxID=2969984 RepID=A0ABT1XTY1_9SPHN|nr:DUF2332 domain-containing protein [Parerythrobacter lacustris]MCR2835071.1 DUF2332 domain-containing protein [Parerythrobacter lacustris]